MVSNYAAPKYVFEKYTGANSSAVLALLDSFAVGAWSIVSEVGGLLTLGKSGSTYACYTGDYAVCRKDFSGNGIVSAADFIALYFTVLNSLGIGTSPSLVLNQTATVTVTLKPAFFDSNYTATAVVTGGLGLLGSLQVQSVTIVDEDTVDVAVKNTGIVTLSSAAILVQAVHN